MTPNDGFGGIIAIESAAHLANAIYSHIAETTSDQKPDHPATTYKQLTPELIKGTPCNHDSSKLFRYNQWWLQLLSVP